MTMTWYAIRSKEGGYLGVIQEWRNVPADQAFLIRDKRQAYHKAKPGDTVVPVTITFHDDQGEVFK